MATTSFSQRHRCSPLPLPLPSLCSCPCRPSPLRTLVFNRPSAKLGNLDLLFDGNKGLLGLGQNGVFARRRVITAVARAEPEHLGDDNADQEVHKGRKLSSNEDVVSEHQQKASQLKKRIFFGLGIGLSVGVVVLAGGWVFAAAVAAAVFIGARIGATWPILLGGQAHWTVGLVATRISFSSIIAADTYAFVGGKVSMHHIYLLSS
ncbi:hypothetical protein C1H46_030027 [Malus baccata]|uniref:phosphatidate cytidylyltransferase n=1 Tax=Malus baccata TaxID=106549 RepID=A0A540LD55_MALBA|nr:hypothetical protein C1H46_030027 [Malus baccata]